MSSETCDHARQAAAWVLGTLTPEEAERFGAHLETCAICQAEVARLQDAADAMADAVAPVTTPNGLRARLMAAVGKEAELFRAAEANEHDPVSTRRPRSGLLRRTLVGVAAVGLVAGGSVLGYVLADAENDPAELRTIPGEVTKAAGAPDARAAVLVRGDDSRLMLSDVDRPPDGRVYQVWLVRPQSTPVPTGELFSVGGTGDTTVSLPPLRDARRMIVTFEPTRGSTVPTVPPVIVVQLSAPG